MPPAENPYGGNSTKLDARPYSVNTKNQPPLAVLGAGSWGTALAGLLAHHGHPVLLWTRNRPHAQEMITTGRNPSFLGPLALPSGVEPTAQIDRVVDEAHHYIIAVPSHAFRSVLNKLNDAVTACSAPPTICWGTKGFESGTGLLLSEVFDQVLGQTAQPAVLSGPSFAIEVAQRLPTALTVAARNETVADTVASWFRDNRTRVYTSTDLSGVQLGGAIKNVMAIAAGISDGLGFGANARAALIARGLAEMSRLGVVLGGQIETFMGLTGMGDLILTCTDDQSRNRRVGLGLGKGKSKEDILSEIGQEAEGINTTRELYRKSAVTAVEMPITEQVYKVLFEDLDPTLAVTALLSRQARTENP